MQRRDIEGLEVPFWNNLRMTRSDWSVIHKPKYILVLENDMRADLLLSDLAE